MRHSCLLAVLLFAAPALAGGEQQRVVIVADRSSQQLAETSTRLRAELEAAGFAVLSIDGVSAPAIDPKSRGPVAVARLREDATGLFIELWGYNRERKTTFVRRVVTSVSTDAPMVLAVRAQEALRAGLLDIQLETPLQELSAPPEVARWIVPTQVSESQPAGAASHPAMPRKTIEVAVGAGFIGATGGVGLGWGPAVQAQWWPSAPHSIGLRLAPIEFGVEVSENAGNAVVRQEMALARYGYTFARIGTHAQLRATFGAGVYHLRAKGSARPPAEGKSADVWALATGFGLGSSLSIGRTVAVVGEMETIALLPEPGVAMNGHRVASTGRPMLAGFVGLGGSW